MIAPLTFHRSSPGGSSRPALRKDPFAPCAGYPQGLLIGLDVGSTTVKAVVVDPVSDAVLWKDYQRHETKQPEKCLEFLRRIEADVRVPPAAMRIFLTGSGSSGIAPLIGGRFVQEVNAVSLAVEKLYPDVEAVIELGGQDAKIIVFKTDDKSGAKKKVPSMNDKCAGGTGAVIDKITAKLRIPADRLCDLGYRGIKLHPVAGKCGVFAETDINGLQKSGVPAGELMASLFESIVQQNLSVLTRGHTLRPRVLLLGGPNTYIRGMVECWRANIPVIWRERRVPLPAGYTVSAEATPEEIDRAGRDLITVPDHAQYFAALGAVEFGRIEVGDEPDTGVYAGPGVLEWYITRGRIEEKQAAGSRGLVRSEDDLTTFKERYRKKPWRAEVFAPGTQVQAFLGVDGGSTSTKGVLLDRDRRVVAKAYQLSKGNPIEDTVEIVGALQQQIDDQGCTLDILGAGTTGYAKDILKDVLGADTALVETVAHTEACLHFYPHTDVIVDVGGQDIKLIVLKHGQVKDFKLNTQCSAGNGYFLQSTAQGFGVAVEEFADRAFAADAMPAFGYGCAVFMQSDIVDFQRQGWQPHEIMAGLAAVLPKNIWLYVSQIPNLAKLGSNFVLQGGTQHNLAAVKSQVDFIESRFPGTGVTPQVVVHEHCGESGAIGCALEAHRLYTDQGRRTTFIGVDRVRSIQYRTTRNEETRCYFCKNKCLRTFIDVRTSSANANDGGGASDRRSGGASAPPVDRANDGGGASDRRSGGASAPPMNRADPPRAATAVSIDLQTHTSRVAGEEGQPSRIKRGTPASAAKSKVPLLAGEQRLIIATCEKGTVEDVNDMREIKVGLDAVKKAHPNLVEWAAREVFKPTGAARIESKGWRRSPLVARRAAYRVGIPRVLNMYSVAPFFTAWLESLGIAPEHIVWSDYTSEELYKEGAKRGAIDPCFPSKIGIPHVHNLLHRKHQDPKRGPLDCIFFPMIDALPSPLEHCQSHRSCPTVATTPEAVKAAFIKESDLFTEHRIRFINPLVDLCRPALAARAMYHAFERELGVTEEESRLAVQRGLAAQDAYDRRLRAKGREVLEALEREDRIGVVVLARPYHNDPGLNHEICDELQKMGYPILTQDALPIDRDILDRLFGDEVARGDVRSALSVDDVWKNSYSENTTRKVWAAKYVARHPNLVALELSSFKCGHDAPIYSVVEEIVEASGTPYFCFKDIDENKPAGSIKIRLETIAYFLSRYREKVVSRQRALGEIDERLAALEARLRQEMPRAPVGQEAAV